MSFRSKILFIGLALAAQTHAQASNSFLSWLIQNVCEDGNGNQIAGDPATCGASRDVNIGEPLPYILTDFDRSNNDVTYESFSSIPVAAEDGTLKILIFKSGQGNFDASYTFSFDDARDGYDLIDTTFGSYTSIIRTSDGGCFDQMFSSDGGISSTQERAGGWIHFPYAGDPSTWAQSSSTSVTTYKVQITPNIPNCSNGNSAGVTYWNAPASYPFETGKTLTAIKTWHYAGSDLSSENNALEIYYFTQEYGATRWEAWEPQSRCFAENGDDAPICHPENSSTYPLQGRCSVLNVSSMGIPGLDSYGGQNWVRVDCRDMTNYIALNTPQLMLDNVIAQNDGYVDINYAATVNA